MSLTTSSMGDFVTKSGQLFNSIQGTLDKQFGQIAEAVHIATHDNSEFFSPIPAVNAREMDGYVVQVKEHWTEYKDICSSLIRAKESLSTPSTEMNDSDSTTTNAFKEIPQVFFNSDYKQSGFEQQQIFTQPIRISIQNQGRINGQLSTYLKTIEQHLVKHLSNVDGLLRSLMSIAVIQSDIAIAHDRVGNAKNILDSISQGEVQAGLRLLMLVRRRARMFAVMHLLDLVDQTAQAKPSVDSLVKEGDFNAATDLVQSTRTILTGPLAGVNMVERVAIYIEEHGRSIDNIMEVEFADAVVEFVFSESITSLKAMLTSMAARELLIPSIQIKLKEVLNKRLKRDLKPIKLNDEASLFEFLHTRLSRLAEFIKLVGQVGQEETKQIQKLSCLRLFESVAATGLARISQSVAQTLGEAGSGDIFSMLKISELTSIRHVVVTNLTKIEQLYADVFSSDLADHLSFASSIINSSPQNGFAPDVELTLANLARQRLWNFHQLALTQVEAALADEKWDKSTPPTPEVVAILAWLDPPPPVDGSASEASPSAAASKFVKLNRVNFILVASGMPILRILNEYLTLALRVPGVALDCLTRLVAVVRLVNTSSRDLVLEGKMSVTLKKAINATNLALASQLIGMLGQLVGIIGRKFCTHYGIENELVSLSDTASGDDSSSSHDVLVEDPSAVLNELLLQTVMELNEHKMDIFIKLGDILIARFDYHLKVWFALASTDGTAASPMDGIVKDFGQMYKVLLKSLQSDNLKRVFSRAFSESASHFSDKLRELKASPSTPTKVLAEFACKFRIDLLFLYQNLQVGEAMAGVKSALNNMVADMLDETEAQLPLVDKSLTAEAAVEKLRHLMRDDQIA